MRKANIIRSIFWGLIAIISLSLGIIGIIYNNNIFDKQKDDLNRIIEIFNNNNTIVNYESIGTYIIASLDGKNIKIKYDGAEKKEYTYKLKNGYLETNLNPNDNIENVILMILADSIAVNKGNLEGDTYSLFNNNSLLNYNLKNGIEYTQKNNKYKVKLNINSPILSKNNKDIEINQFENN